MSSRKTKTDLIPTHWAFAADADDMERPGPAIAIARMVSPFYDGVRYAVREGSFCLSVDGEWEYEPMPSSRNDVFYDRFRFRTFAKAVKAARKARAEKEAR